VFWRRVDLQVDADVSEKYAVSIFRGNFLLISKHTGEIKGSHGSEYDDVILGFDAM
jgi:hypothetical protein